MLSSRRLSANSVMGVTLPELIITLAIISILLFSVVSGMQSILLRHRAMAQVNQIVTAINFTRSEAIKTGQVITFCKSSDHKTCGGNWRDGQIIIDAHKQVLRVYSALIATDNLDWVSNLKKDDFLQFNATGFTQGQNGSFYYCPNHNASYAQRIIVEQTGRIRIENQNVKCV